MKKRFWATLTVITMLCVAGCQNSEKTDGPVATNTPEPTATVAPTEEVEPTVTPEPTATFAPTATPNPYEGKLVFSGKIKELRSADVGDSVYFGTYEQDNDFANGPEAIEWLVLDKVDEKVLVISKHALDVKRYNEKREDVTWETCTLRKWLNGEFYEATFTEKEHHCILETLVVNNDNPEYGTEGGNNTLDKVFLLSGSEAISYFNEEGNIKDATRRTWVTEYAKAQKGRHDSAYYDSGDWWLRSPGSLVTTALTISYEGKVTRTGNSVDMLGRVLVRPVIWIDGQKAEEISLVTKTIDVSSKEVKSIEKIASVATGDFVMFGSYEQDNNSFNGPEPIEWVVLEKKDNKALLLSRYVLDREKYAESTYSRWEDSYLRSWLNGVFYQTAFNGVEQEKIVSTLEVLEDYSSGEKNVNDKVFVLTEEHITDYFSLSILEREKTCTAKATEYSKATKGIVSEVLVMLPWGSLEYYGNDMYWIRPSDPKDASTEMVSWMPTFAYDMPGTTIWGVRPAIWVSY